ncbi:MAG: polyhydroxyalkanoate synthesis repressor PhaR [Rhodospirillaceae bacterium]|jgi:polyhydroxyalkanoate synthesis repressor PhaR|nr:polyhydroxyalkanoate synthesis repressor PhaR [Rhodospirillaceae bacterium]MBT5374678.1 polyhydroxyalkanoate synthesis repressor PhaR [Rhodospirillaceae bacterium]MBT5752758.1 polyhydroxyalkanoate synthesis repressor PhaR [Rhodospirillaceae bacterium]
MAKKTPETEGASTSEPIVIKKYANRRLYNTATSSYVTLDYLCQMVKDNKDFVVKDAKSGDDITRSVLTQIIVEEEGKGQNLLPVNFLRQLIGFYGDNLQYVVPGYLDHSMQNFCQNEDQMRDHVETAMGNFSPFGQLDEMSKKNMALFQQAMGMFSPFSPGAGEEEESAGTGNDAASGNAPGSAGLDKDKEGAAIKDLEGRLSKLQDQIDALSKK